MSKYIRISLVVLVILAPLVFMAANQGEPETTTLPDDNYSITPNQFPPSTITPTTTPSNNYYLQYEDSVPVGVTAKCNDGTYSYSQNRQGTCSHHGGVEEWY